MYPFPTKHNLNFQKGDHILGKMLLPINHKGQTLRNQITVFVINKATTKIIIDIFIFY